MGKGPGKQEIGEVLKGDFFFVIVLEFATETSSCSPDAVSLSFPLSFLRSFVLIAVTVEESCWVWVGLKETPIALVMLRIVETSGHDGTGMTGVFNNGVHGGIPALGIELSMAVKGLIAHEESMGDNLGRCVRRYAADT